MDREAVTSLPKVELHLHLDCSLSFDVVKELRPKTSRSEYEELFIAPEKCFDLAEFLRCTESGIELMQTEHGLQQSVRDLFSQLKRENVVYAEIRFAPLQHLERGLSAERVVEVIADAVRHEVTSNGIAAGIILCTLRHYTEAQGLQTVKLVEQYASDSHVVALDLAADEAGFPIDAHVPSFDYALRKDIPRTAHAGEARGAESVAETLHRLQPDRIGHGVRSSEDERVIELLVEKGIHLEICPTCNVQTDIYDVFEDHPIDTLYRAGVSVGINTDARALVNVTLTDEYLKLIDTFGWRGEQLYRCNLNALANAFTSDSEKRRLSDLLTSAYSPYLE